MELQRYLTTIQYMKNIHKSWRPMLLINMIWQFKYSTVVHNMNFLDVKKRILWILLLTTS